MTEIIEQLPREVEGGVCWRLFTGGGQGLTSSPIVALMVGLD